MIILDVETSGLNFNKCGIWQIGALDLENPKNTFLEEARIDYEDIIEEDALKTTDKKEENLRDKNKQSQKQLLENFSRWLEKAKIKNIICENPQFDWGFLVSKFRKYKLEIPFHHRTFDLHSISQSKFFEVNKKFLIKENHSNMSLPNTLEFCGIEDERRKVEDNKIVKEGKPHNALEDARLEAECFSRLIYGKNLLPEFAKFKIPEYLKQEEK